jgi:hypothetical protein
MYTNISSSLIKAGSPVRTVFPDTYDATYVGVQGVQGIVSTNVQDALESLTRNSTAAIEWRTDENGSLAPYLGNDLISNWASNDVTLNTASSKTYVDGECLTDLINTFKDDIQILKDEIERLKMLLLEN